MLYSSKDLKFTKFNSTTDTCFHLCIFFDEVLLIKKDDNLHAKLFPIYLIGDAKEWISRLPHVSIMRFDKLKSLFFITIIFKLQKKVKFNYLMKIKQR